MAVPRVFVCSTCYDLKYIRENLRYFIKTLGFDPVLSEDGAVFYDPTLHTHDACVEEVPNCQMLVLIIGGRRGGGFRGSEKSITNAEYEQAVKLHIPVFALVEQGVYSEHYVWLKNRDNAAVDRSKIEYPAVDDPRIFDFIEEVRRASTNNALVPFRDFSDIENYLRNQWAGMMYSFLTTRSEARRVEETLAHLTTLNEKMEALTRQVLLSVGDNTANLTLRLYDIMLASDVVRDLGTWGVRLVPATILRSSSLDDLVPGEIVPGGESYNSITSGGPPFHASAKRIDIMRKGFAALQQKLESAVADAGTSVDDYIRNADSRDSPEPALARSDK